MAKIFLTITLILFTTLSSFASEISDKNTLVGGLYSWEPYQFVRQENSGDVVKGMDIEVAKAISDTIGVNIKLEEVAWDTHQTDIKSGLRDIAFGATYTPERSQFAYFSLPYRFEENSLFTKKDSIKVLDFDNPEEFIQEARAQNYKIGVTRGYVYASTILNEFINNPENADIITVSENDLANIKLLVKGHIDGFLADRIAAAALVINRNLANDIKEQRLNIRIPIHIMFSKETTNAAMVDKFNVVIEEFVLSDNYKSIIKKYLYPVLLLETINAEWFFIVGIIGTISFAISSLAIAAKENTTLFGTFIFAMLPSVGGTILRDIMVNKGKILDLFMHPVYMYCTIIVVLSGFVFVRIFNVFGKKTKNEEAIYNFWDNVLILSDSLGQAAFIIAGVVVVVIENITPLWLWAPFFAFITANGGAIAQ
ncbi:MAG UNVERIFIED_CONTAM: transporter substrate-binding domain-containing protein [Rickettsiaceae bacterium]